MINIGHNLFIIKYTAEKIKIIGHIGNEFITSYRDQDTSTKFLYHHDGNMVLVNHKWYKQSHKLFDDTSKYILNDKPYSLQIDYKEDFDLFKREFILVMDSFCYF